MSLARRSLHDTAGWIARKRAYIVAVVCEALEQLPDQPSIEDIEQVKVLLKDQLAELADISCARIESIAVDDGDLIAMVRDIHGVVVVGDHG